MISSEVLSQIRAFVAEREWGQFHTAENLAKSISIESAELLELFQWQSNVDKQMASDEIADVLTYLMLLADHLDIDLNTAILNKLEKNRIKYPVDKARGNSTKYDRL